MRIMFSCMVYNSNLNCNIPLCGSSHNWIMHDLKTVRGYLNRLKNCHWLKTEKFILMQINNSVNYVIANGKLINWQDCPKYLDVYDWDTDKIKRVEVHYKAF